MQTARNRTIDILRLIAAFSVICLHNFTGSGVWQGEEIVAVTRFAVPLFFLFSGYFAANFDRKRKLRQFIRILLWAVLGNLMYLIRELLRQPNDFLMRVRFQQLFTPESIRNLLIFNESPISAHLWFLGAFAYILLLDLLLGWLFDKLPRVVRWCFVGMLMLGGLTLYQLLTRSPNVDYQLYYYRNFLLFGLPFFLSGKLIRTGRFAEIKIPGTMYPMLLWFSCNLAVLEYGAFGPWELYLGSILTVFLLAHLALSHPLYEAPKAVEALAWLGREATLAVYLLHIFFLDWLRGLYWDNIPWKYEFGVFHLIPLGVFLLSLIAGALLAFGRLGVKKLLPKKRGAGR